MIPRGGGNFLLPFLYLGLGNALNLPGICQIPDIRILCDNYLNFLKIYDIKRISIIFLAVLIAEKHSRAQKFRIDVLYRIFNLWTTGTYVFKFCYHLRLWLILKIMFYKPRYKPGLFPLILGNFTFSSMSLIHYSSFDPILPSDGALRDQFCR